MADDRISPARAFDALNVRGLAAKREYVRGLEQRNDPESLSLLVECLCDESWFLRDLAEQAFLRLGEEAAPVLLPLLAQGLWFTRTSAAGILGRLAYRPAVPALIQLSEDGNRTVADAACQSLVAIGRARGAFRIAHVLHRLHPELRRRRLQDLMRRDAGLAGGIERMMANEELMVLEDDGRLADDDPALRASVDGVEWEVLTGPVPRRDEPRTAQGDDVTGTP
ncbi:MAG TPA: hypothetical protein VI792_06795 [Candidatus Eisenbacteria bacterium]